MRYIKQLLLLVLILCSYDCVKAEDHLTFKGIPIEGDLSGFCQKLRGKGFIQTGSQDNVLLFKGNFTGRQATVGVFSTDNGQDVFSVEVFFDNTDSWNTLIESYEYYKSLYIEKYGNPAQCVEKKNYDGDNNTLMMNQLCQGEITYFCTFKAPGGSIQLSIEKASRGKKLFEGFVLIRYQDVQNVNAKRQSDLDEI